MVVVLTLVYQAKAGVLSVQVWSCHPAVAVRVQITSCWAMVPANSRSEFVIVPVGFFEETKFAEIEAEKGAHHRCRTGPSGRVERKPHPCLSQKYQRHPSHKAGTQVQSHAGGCAG